MQVRPEQYYGNPSINHHIVSHSEAALSWCKGMFYYCVLLSDQINHLESPLHFGKYNIFLF